MSKVTKSSTKEAIMTALTEAQEEQNLLHEEVTTLQSMIDEMEITTNDKNDVIVNLESLVQEEDIKKKALIKQLANQTADIELAGKKTEKYDEIKTTLESTRKELEMVKTELFSANKKVEVLTSDLESFKNRALPSGIKKGFSRFFTFKKIAAVSGIVFLIMVLFGGIYMTIPHDNAFMDKVDSIISKIQHNIPVSVINPVSVMTFTETDGIVSARHNGQSNLKTEDGILIEDSVIATWASTAGFDGVLFGTLIELNGKVELERSGEGAFEFSEIGIEHVVSKFKEMGCSNVLALVENKDNLTLPEIFTQTSEGNLEVYESRRKLAGIIPVFWGKEKKQLNIKSDNVYAYITSDIMFMEIKGVKASVSLNAEEDTVKKYWLF